MAFGTNSKVSCAYLTDVLNNTTSMDLDSDTINVANYNNTGTPDQTAASASFAYNAGQWVTANEVTATGWTAGGLALSSITSSFSSNVYSFKAGNRAGGSTDTITNAFGCLIFDNTTSTPVAKQGIAFLAYGGANSVTLGTFTIVFNASGIFTVTL